MDPIKLAAQSIQSASYLVAFTGAGISVESGIPPFRGEGGIWDEYDPQVLDINWFYQHPKESWIAIRDIFYLQFGQKEPNDAHHFLAELERNGILKFLITQNIDDLHYRAGNRRLAEYHGNARELVAVGSGDRISANSIDLLAMSDDDMPPQSPAGELYKPDFIFFGEGIPYQAARDSESHILKSDVVLVIGSTGEVYPAAYLPIQAKQNGATIIEINPSPSAFTSETTDIYIPMKAGEACRLIAAEMSTRA